MPYYAPHPKLAREEMRNRSGVLRREQTLVEKRMWHRLRAKQFYGIKFRRQHPIGPYIVDFCSPSAKLVIELDGGRHADQREYDERRTSYLKQYGFKVLRFWDNEVWHNMDGVLFKIAIELGFKPLAAKPLSLPSPHEWGEGNKVLSDPRPSPPVPPSPSPRSRGEEERSEGEGSL